MALDRAGIVQQVADIIGRELGVVSPSGATLSNRIVVWTHWGLLRIARRHDFDECMVYDTTSAKTVASKKTYDFVTDWSLPNLKTVYSIVLKAGIESRKLVHVPVARMTKVIPDPESRAEGKSTWYVPRGKSISLICIPDAVYNLSIDHSIWPPAMATDTSLPIYTHKDDLIVAATVVDAYLALGQDALAANWEVKTLRKIAELEAIERAKPDYTPKAEEFTLPGPKAVGEWWLDPFVKTAP